MKFLSTIQQQLLYVSVLVVSFGLVSTDAYYNVFGLRYQDIGIPYNHLIYRGFVLPLKQPSFLLIYAVMILSTAYAGSTFTVTLWRLKLNKTVTFYILFALCFFVGFIMARDTGIKLAIDDVYSATTSLRELNMFIGSDEKKITFVNDLFHEKNVVFIVYRDSNKLVLVREPQIRSQRPRFHVIHVGIDKNDFYADSLPPFR